MNSKPKRVSLRLLDDELRDLINASAKIFPLSQEDIDSNNNPNNYEYGRVGNHIYRWRTSTRKWEYIIADDIDISWDEIKSKPNEYPPKSHTHEELHTHPFLHILNSITEELINEWNTIVNKADKNYVDESLSGKSNINHNHDNIYSKIGHDHDDNYSKIGHDHDGSYYRKEIIDESLSGKSNINHNHDGRYYKKNEVDTEISKKANQDHSHKEEDIIDLDKYTQEETNALLSGKSNLSHSHAELHIHTNKDILNKLIETEQNEKYDISGLSYIEDIRSGYTEGHSHVNLDSLNKITEDKINNWDAARDHVDNKEIHVTIEDKENWNSIYNEVYYELVSFANTISEMIADKSDKNHLHKEEDITDLDKYSKEEIDGKLETKANQDYVNDELSKKANNTTVSYHTNNQEIHVTKTKKEEWDSKANGNHSHKLSGLSEKSYNSLTEKPKIPSKTSELENDSDFVSISDIPNVITVSESEPTDGSLWLKITGTIP